MEKVNFAETVNGGYNTTEKMQVQYIKSPFSSTLANVEVIIKHFFVSRIPKTIQLCNGKGGVVYESKVGNNAVLYLKNTIDNDTVDLLLI